MLVVLVGCASHRTAEANSTYAADQLACVDKSETKAEADACRAKVREAWHVDAGGAK